MPKRLKIAILIDQLVPGGVQKDASFEVSHLNKLGHKAKLWVLMRKGYQKRYSQFFPKIPIQFLSDRYPKFFRNSKKFPIFTFFSTLHLLSPYLAPRVIKNPKIDIVIAHGTTTCLTALAFWKKQRIPYIAIIPDPMEYILKKVYVNTPLKYFFWVLSPILYYLEKQIIKNAKTVIVVSEKHLPFIKKNYKVTPEIHLPGTFPLAKLPQSRDSYLIASSRWEKAKNPELLLKIIKALPKRKLIIAGNWTNNSELISFRKKIQKENLSTRVILKTDILPRQLTKLYVKALAWVHPNIEAFGLGGLEAASYGCPVIMPAESGLAQILKDKEDGFFPKRITANEFVKPLKFLVNNPQIAQKMGKSAWQKVRRGYSWQIHTRKLEDLIYSVLDRLEIIALETGHAQGTVISGGDKLLEEMSTYFSSNISLTVIVPVIAAWHWRNKNAKVITLWRSFLDNNPQPFAVFANYLLRIITSLRILSQLSSGDILYSSTNVFPDVIPAFLAKLLNPQIKWFARVHHLSPPPHQRPGNWLVNAGSYLLQEVSLFVLKKKADLVAALNTDLLKTLINKGFKKEKLIVVTAGIDIKNWQDKVSWTETKTYDAIFLGRMHPSKGIFDLVPIWGLVCQSHPKAKLAIIGQTTPPLVQKISSDAKLHQISQNISILGPLSQELVQKSLKKSRVFLFTDHEAGFGLAPLEAMSLGLPVIGWDIGVLGKVFKKGFVRVKAFDTDRFAQVVVSLLSDHKRLQNLSREAKNEAQKHNWQKVSQDFEKILVSLNLQSQAQ